MRSVCIGLLLAVSLSFGQDVDYVEGVFQLYDKNDDYSIDLEELNGLQRELELAVEQANDAEAHALLREKFQAQLDTETWLRADVDDDRQMSKGELVEYLWLQDFHEAPPPSLNDCRFLAQLEVKEVFEPLLEVLDLDGDGRLSRAEAEGAFGDPADDPFGRIDVAKKGSIGPEEFEEFSYRELLLLYELDDSSEEAPD